MKQCSFDARSWGFNQATPQEGEDGKIDWENECGPLLPERTRSECARSTCAVGLPGIPLGPNPFHHVPFSDGEQ